MNLQDHEDSETKINHKKRPHKDFLLGSITLDLYIPIILGRENPCDFQCHNSPFMSSQTILNHNIPIQVRVMISPLERNG